ncbi:hypothetical protein HF521_014780 [Silurus meridionalis]|uniref:Uncharacterized protein n=1 Tax=Silurus meridionalis TaxID=175797 RepID=A0A8T0A972_SILME|nr:hypothetical protein HF521_014780 [Silurus meridionalis]
MSATNCRYYRHKSSVNNINNNLHVSLRENNSKSAWNKAKPKHKTEEDIPQHKSGRDSGTSGPGGSGPQRCITIYCTD